MPGCARGSKTKHEQTHLNLVHHLMQRQILKPTEADEVIYPEHDDPLVGIAATARQNAETWAVGHAMSVKQVS
jgi:hypothetical protein